VSSNEPENPAGAPTGKGDRDDAPAADKDAARLEAIETWVHEEVRDDPFDGPQNRAPALEPEEPPAGETPPAQEQQLNQAPADPLAAQAPPWWLNPRLMLALGLGLFAAAVAAYFMTAKADQNWLACKSPETVEPAQIVETCGAVLLTGEKPPQVLAFAHRKRAGAFLKLGEIALAVRDYSGALEHVRDDAVLYAERGAAQMRNGQPQQAADDFTAALGLDPNLWEMSLARGRAYLALNQTEQAIADFTQALAVNPAADDAVYRRAIAQVRLERLAEAAADYDRALELAPNNPSYWNARCWFRASMGIDMDLALQDCDQALKLKANFAPAMDSRAFVLLRLGRWEDALAAYDKAIAVETRYAWPYFGRGLVKKRLGDEVGAQADFDAARAIQPDIDQQYANYGETP
jgi:tetratricopeptide (TPR) repeat protein